MRWFVPFSIAVLSLGCSPDGSTGGGGRGGDGGGGLDGGAAPECSSADDCAAGMRCSVVGRCIGDGVCLADGDCAAGQRCGPASDLCLAPGACAAMGDCPAGETCDLDSGSCQPETCGSEPFDLTSVPPNMLILLDRSGSMDGEIGGRTRWDLAKDAIATVTTAYDSDIRFGLATYSSCTGGGCSAGSIVVPIADMNASAINSFLSPLLGEGSSSGTPPRYLCDSGDPETSTGKSLYAFVGEASLQDAMRDNFVLLVTDGRESSECTDGGTKTGPMGAAALLAQTIPVKTYVIGFSSDAPAGELNAVAAAGGTSMYYPAEDGAALMTAFDTIAGSVVSCDFVLDRAPPDPEMLYVYFNDAEPGVPEDPTDGWTYDESSMTLRFHGASCDELRSGAVTDIDVVFGCPGPVLE